MIQTYHMTLRHTCISRRSHKHRECVCHTSIERECVCMRERERERERERDQLTSPGQVQIISATRAPHWAFQQQAGLS